MQSSNSRICADASLSQDHLDRIPDSLVLLIFNKVADVRALGRCSAVSKRFNLLVPQVHDVYLKIDRVLTLDGDPSEETLNLKSPEPYGLLSNLLKLILLAIFKPFAHIRNPDGRNKPLLPQVSHHCPSQVLKNFAHIRNLRIELPSGDVGTDDGVLLKWRAEFGSTLQNCVILGGTRIDPKGGGLFEDNESIPESFCTNGGLKLRVVWTISSLIAASTRHHLLRPIIEDHPTLRSVVLTDSDGQGTLSMGMEQLKEFMEKPMTASALANRTLVPASSMRLRYAPYLELTKGMGMQGATLVAIRPSGDDFGSRKEAEAFLNGAFDGPLGDVAKALMKRRTYLLEMNGF